METTMVYRSELHEICDEIEQARADVVNAHRDGNINKINKADRKLADLHHQYRECSGGRIPDDR
jgi:hypothetical protein